MDTKHTPGPWRVGLTIGSPHVSPEGPWGWYQTDIEGPTGEGCFLELRQYHGGEVGQANAHLIAAAPDLLEACKVALSGYRGLTGDDDGPEYFERTLGDVMGALSAAIAKAEGR